MKSIWRFTLRILKLFLYLGLALAIIMSIGVQIPMTEAPTAAISKDILITDITLISPETGQALPSQTVAISNGRITFVGAIDQAPALNQAQTISGAGKFLIPGLWDMHVHTISLSPQLHFPLLIANGITHVRDMGDGCSWTGSLDCVSLSKDWRKQIQVGTMSGPHIHQAAQFHVEDLGEDLEDNQDAQQIQQRASALVSQLKNRGDELIKLQLAPTANPTSFYAMLDAARLANMPVAGHFPYTASLLDPRAKQLVSIEHDNSVLPQCAKEHAQFDGRNRSKQALLQQIAAQDCTQVLDSMAQAGTAYVPTHVASNGQDWMLVEGTPQAQPHNQYVVAPQRWLWWLYAKFAVAGVKQEHRSVVEAYYQASLKLSQQARQHGVKVLAGSDAMDAYVTHGFSLHEELQQLVKAGFTPAQALAAATTEPAAFMGKQNEYGKIAVGYQADLLILNKNPLIDIAHSQSIDTVIHQGRVHSRTDLDQLLAYVKQQANSFAMACQFLWRMVKP